VEVPLYCVDATGRHLLASQRELKAHEPRKDGIGAMNCGTYQLSLEASAARPDVARGSAPGLLDALPGTGHGIDIFAGSHAAASPICAITAPNGQTWLQMWTEKPAYPVAHTDRHSPRPLERSP
jgi:hypothetical protein